MRIEIPGSGFRWVTIQMRICYGGERRTPAAQPGALMTRTSSLMFSFLPATLALALLGCDAEGDKPTESGDDSAVIDSVYVPPLDNDGDGVTVTDGDCDDEDAARYPGRSEDCDGVDNNCNGVIDEGLADVDSDGTADCMDLEECDGVDNDGDTEVDEGFGDLDGNGVADCVGTEICDGLDNNDDGRIDEGYDADGDGATSCGDDCNDADASVGPGAVEIGDDWVDNNCDGLIDDGSWAEGDLAITEIMNNPGAVADPDGEWFEVYNTSDRTLILNGLVISSGAQEHQVTDLALVLLEPGDFFIFASNDDDTTNGDVEVGYVYDVVSLSNEDDDIALSAGAVLIDSMTWDNGVTLPDPDGASFGTDYGNYDATLNDDVSIWCEATLRWTSDPTSDYGSPGDDNEYCSTYDHDHDGFNGAEGDCDDADDTTYPGAWEGTDPVDNDCDGVAETAPVAVASATSSGFACDDISLSSSGSYDIEGASLSYLWELTSAPGGSARGTADIDTTTSANPTFNPDMAGTYTFSLTVNDGGTGSMPSSVSVTVDTRGTNSTPVANAGTDQSYADSSTCSAVAYTTTYTCDDCDSYDFTLSGASTTDADGDELTYDWVVTAGTYGTLSSATGESTTLTVSGVPATYGSTLTDTITVTMTATDCMGAASRDDVQAVYTCTGA